MESSRPEDKTEWALLKRFLIVWLKEDLPRFQKWFIQYIGPFHLALFYLTGNYYHISKRITKIRYVRGK
jgi:hypothetical protein